MAQEAREKKGNRPLTEEESMVGAVLFDEMKTKRGVRYSPLSGKILELENIKDDDDDSLRMKADVFKKLDQEELDDLDVDDVLKETMDEEELELEQRKKLNWVLPRALHIQWVEE